MDQNLVGCIGRNWLCPATVESRPLLSHGDTFIMAQPPYAEARRFPQLDWPLTSTAKAQLTHQKKEKFTYHADKLRLPWPQSRPSCPHGVSVNPRNAEDARFSFLTFSPHSPAYRCARPNVLCFYEIHALLPGSSFNGRELLHKNSP